MKIGESGGENGVCGGRRLAARLAVRSIANVVAIAAAFVGLAIPAPRATARAPAPVLAASAATGLGPAVSFAAVGQIGAALAAKPTFHVVVVRSTILPGTLQGLLIPLLERHSGRRAA